MFAAAGECCSFSLQWRAGGVALSFPTPRCREAFEEASHDEWSHPQSTPLCVCRRPAGLFARSEECDHHSKEIFPVQTLLPFTRHHNQTLLVSAVTIFPLTIQTGLEFCLLYRETVSGFPTELNPLPRGLRKKPRQINLRTTTG